ncbi:DUF6596 domain-containing protein [Nonomuraea sp. B12E4]|uniref:DUF6596 domain-containing protein n=1 Tax=Nonomuraea sp. B12E4 TaxID=3153564 RepID=UPI00325E8DC6
MDILLPTQREVAGLLALMLLIHARRAARTGAGGELVLLDEQDRGRWDRSMIEEGLSLVRAALTGGPPGPYAAYRRALELAGAEPERAHLRRRLAALEAPAKADG